MVVGRKKDNLDEDIDRRMNKEATFEKLKTRKDKIKTLKTLEELLKVKR